MVIIPYIVLAAVAALFFAVSYFIICGFPLKSKKKEEPETGGEEKENIRPTEEKSPPFFIKRRRWTILPRLSL